MMKMMFMTQRHLGLSKFLRELGLVAEYFKWDSPGPSVTRQCCYIRGYQNGMRFCPLTAVCYATKGMNYSADKWWLAARLLNIPHDLAEMVQQAADGGVAYNAESADLHERLLKAIGL